MLWPVGLEVVDLGPWVLLTWFDRRASLDWHATGQVANEFMEYFGRRNCLIQGLRNIFDQHSNSEANDQSCRIRFQTPEWFLSAVSTAFSWMRMASWVLSFEMQYRNGSSIHSFISRIDYRRFSRSMNWSAFANRVLVHGKIHALYRQPCPKSDFEFVLSSTFF